MLWAQRWLKSAGYVVSVSDKDGTSVILQRTLLQKVVLEGLKGASHRPISPLAYEVSAEACSSLASELLHNLKSDDIKSQNDGMLKYCRDVVQCFARDPK